ncbi:MAG: bifunctional methylenetetrahydrofolate dehydrogenase/methenyltetrahydrofolate cyclohydrolase FolD [Bacillota bacterium]|nr:bifunctional methylenetetrahydrofolate dehydrogenase/methenyltetrahydrofolate cyclohydrolase FolD [Bacillota bacterium]
MIRGKELASSLRSRTGADVERLSRKAGKRPGLVVIQVGDDPGSLLYVNNKKKACEEAGIRSYSHHLPASVSQLELLALIDQLNTDTEVHGILCQLPLPDHIDEFTIICAIKPEKDVDGFHPVNVGLLSLGRDCLLPCTPAGIIAMLKAHDLPIKGKRCVIVGRSNIVGKPIAQLMLREHATVTIAHSRTQDLPGVCREADILIVAIGKPQMVNADYVKPGAVVIDVGINRNEHGKVVGDVDFAAVEPIAGAITPVPGGVGLMTVAMLLKNTVDAFCRIEGLHL